MLKRMVEKYYFTIIISLSITLILTSTNQVSSLEIEKNFTLDKYLDLAYTGYKIDKDPLPLQFSDPTIQIAPYYLVYSADYQKIIDPPPSEGEHAAVWFNLVSRNENLNLNKTIFVLAYSIDPKGELGNFYSLEIPIEFSEGYYFRDKNYESSRGLTIDTDIPGIWEIKYLAIDKTGLDRFNNLSDADKIKFRGFKSYKVHVLNWDEKQNIKLARSSIYLSPIFALIVGVLLALYSYRLSEKSNKKKEKKEKISALEALIHEVEHNTKFADEIFKNKNKYIEKDQAPFRNFITINLEKILSGKYITSSNLLNELFDYYDSLQNMNEFLKRLRILNVPQIVKSDLKKVIGMAKIHKKEGKNLVSKIKQEINRIYYSI